MRKSPTLRIYLNPTLVAGLPATVPGVPRVRNGP